jgi:small conductance mechanosensitive channel
MIQDRLERLWLAILEGAPNILLTLVVMVLALWLVRRLASRVTAAQGFTRRAVRTETLRAVLISALTVVIYVVAGASILGTLGINVAALLAGVSILGLAVSFGAQSLVKDVITGFFVLLEDQYGVGDVIRVNGASGLSGDVESLNLRVTVLRDLEGTAHVIPNSEIKTVSVLSKDFARVVGDTEVPHDYPLERALELITRVAQELHSDPAWKDKFLEGPQILGVQTLSPTSVTLRVLFKVRPKEQWGVNREFKRRVKLAFENEGLRTPLPQMSLALPAQAKVQVAEDKPVEEEATNPPIEETR